MFLLARTMVLNHPLPSFVPYTLLAGVVFVALFMATRQEFKRGWINHALLPLTIIGNFVDVLSYVRLYAVGYASVAVIVSFNGMASSIGWHNPFTAVAAVILLALRPLPQSGALRAGRAGARRQAQHARVLDAQGTVLAGIRLRAVPRRPAES